MRRIEPAVWPRLAMKVGGLFLLTAPATARAARAADQLAEGDVFFLRVLLGLGTLPAILIAFLVLLFIGGLVSTICLRVTGKGGEVEPEA